MNKLPNVSILMPTYNRNKFLDLALDNVINQTYPHELLELVIIDDGIEKFIKNEKLVREKIFPIKLKYLRINPKNKLKIGVKRNFLVHHASNEICINMDDDDIYLNNYILKSVLFLLVKPIGIVGSNGMIFYFVNHGKFTRIQCAAKRQIHEATMCFTKYHWRRTGGFLPEDRGEGPGMIDGYEAHAYNINIDGLMYCICHKNNTYPKDAFLYKKELNLFLEPNKFKYIQEIFFDK